MHTMDVLKAGLYARSSFYTSQGRIQDFLRGGSI